MQSLVRPHTSGIDHNPIGGGLYPLQGELQSLTTPLGTFRAVGTFETGGTFSGKDLVFYDGSFYAIRTGASTVVAPASVPDSAWINMGKLLTRNVGDAVNFVNPTTPDANQTEAVTALFAAAEFVGVSVNFAGITKVVLDSTAQIPQGVSVYGAGVVLKFVHTGNRPAYDFLPAFSIRDVNTPLVAVPETWEAGTLWAGRTSVRNTTFNFTEGMLAFDTQINFGKRYTTNTVFYKLRQVFKVYKDGLLHAPIDLSIAGGVLGAVHFRAMPAKELVVSGLTLDITDAPQLQAFKVERNKCSFRDIRVINNAAGGSTNVRTVLYLYKVCDINIDGWHGDSAETNTIGAGSYIIGGDFVSGLTLRNVGNDGGLPSIGFNVLNGVSVKDSHVNRFDCHAWMHNVYIQHVTFGMYGLTYGIGGGSLTVLDSTCIKGYVPGRGSFVDLDSYTFISARADYGGVFYGDITVQNSDIALDERVDLSGGSADFPYKLNLIAFDADGDYGFTDRKPYAYSITVRDCSVNAPSASWNFDFCGISFGGTLESGSLFPARILVDGLNFKGSPRALHTIQPIMFPSKYTQVFAQGLATEPAGNCSISIRNVQQNTARARAASRSSYSWTPASADQTNANRVVPQMFVSDCTGVSLRWSINGSYVRLRSSELRDFSTFSGAATTPNITISDTTLYFVDGSQSQVAQARLSNCRALRHSAGVGGIQFGGVLSAQGVTFAAGVTLLNGSNPSITVDSVFTGYKP